MIYSKPHPGRAALALFALLLASFAVAAESPPVLAPQLEAFRPLIDKTWRGEFKNSTPENPIVDIARWERALNGKAIRLLHSINDGVYGGETLFVWDQKKQTVAYYYFTTAGFMTTGTFQVKDGRWITTEAVSGNTNGITEVRGTSEVLPNGTFHVKTEHLKDGEWFPGHEVTYKQAAEAKVKFK